MDRVLTGEIVPVRVYPKNFKDLQKSEYTQPNSDLFYFRNALFDKDAQFGRISKKIENKNRFAYLFELFINLTYCLFLVPFRLQRQVEDEDGRLFRIHVNHFQRIICHLVCASTTFVCFLVAYAQIAGKNIDNNPVVIFNFWSYSVFCGWCFIFINVFWRKQRTILDIMNQNPTTPDNPTNVKEWVIALTFFGAVVLLEVFNELVYYLFPNKYDLQGAAEIYSGEVMHVLFLKETRDPIPWKKLEWSTLAISIWHFTSWQLFGSIKALTYVFVTFSCIFLIGKMNEASRILQYRSREAWEIFVDVRRTVEAINELCSVPVLGIYSLLVPFLSSVFVNRWDSPFLEYKVLTIFEFLWPMIALITAAEASRKGDVFLTLVKEISQATEDKTGMLGSAYFVLENANLSVRGGKFFKMSYGFLGTTMSIILTYAIVILQFLYEPEDACRFKQ